MQAKGCDGFDAIADYVFQVTHFAVVVAGLLNPFEQNSNATSVLMHHGDLEEIHAVGYADTMNFKF